MILQRLCELAQREQLLEDPDFLDLMVRYEIHVGDDGEFLELVPLGADQKGALVSAPRIPKRTVNVSPGFLVDNSKYVLGQDPKDPDREKFKAFQKQVADLVEATSDPGARAVLRFLERLDEHLPLLKQSRGPEGWDGSENLLFYLVTDGTRVHERPDVRAYYAEARRSEESGRIQQCLVTGEYGPATRLHPPIKRIPAASTAGGVSLVSFNSAAFRSHGLEQGENAPISRAAAEGYAAALNWLLAQDGDHQFRQGLRIGPEAVCVFWVRGPNEIALALRDEFDPNTSAGPKQLHNAPWRGQPIEIQNGAFYAMTLSASGARLVVRDWFETALDKLVANIRRFFQAIEIAGSAGLPTPLGDFLRALERPGHEVPSELGTRLFGAILKGGKMPGTLLPLALRRMRINDENNHALRLRAALIKAVLVINYENKFNKELSMALDVDNLEKAYLLGRLFSVLERLQGAAQGDINATIRDRYYGGASTSPLLVFPRLLRLSVHHAAKLDSPYLESLKAKILDKLDATDPFPRQMILQDQGLFALGYYHQRESFYQKKPASAPEQPEQPEQKDNQAVEAGGEQDV